TTVLDMPGIEYGLVGAAALAAAMSSSDVITHSAALEFTDGVVRHIKKDLTDKAALLIMRGAVVMVGALAYFVAVLGGQGLIALLAGAYGSIVQFAPGIYSALYWKRATAPGVIAGLLAGFIVNIYYQMIYTNTPFDIHAGILGLMVNIVVFAAVSYATKPQAEEIAGQYVNIDEEVEENEKVLP